MEISKDRVTFYGKSIKTGETVSGWYWENRGDGYIVTRDESIQPPLYRTYAVERWIGIPEVRDGARMTGSHHVQNPTAGRVLSGERNIYYLGL